MGVVSLILWSLLLIVSLKYAILILRADNHGEGGIVALLALLDARHAPRDSWRASLLIVGLIGAALLYGDGVITPAISVLSAVEGLKLDAPQLTPLVVPISITILLCLFLVQRKGTQFIGHIFGPVMLVWFVVIGLLGLRGIVRRRASLPLSIRSYALPYLNPRGTGTGFAVSVPTFLAVTGAEAMYADMGHFGRLPIRCGWFCRRLACPDAQLLRPGSAAPLRPEASKIRSTCSLQAGPTTRSSRWRRSPPSSHRRRSSPARSP